MTIITYRPVQKPQTGSNDFLHRHRWPITPFNDSRNLSSGVPRGHQRPLEKIGPFIGESIQSFISDDFSELPQRRRHVLDRTDMACIKTDLLLLTHEPRILLFVQDQQVWTQPRYFPPSPVLCSADDGNTSDKRLRMNAKMCAAYDLHSGLHQSFGPRWNKGDYAHFLTVLGRLMVWQARAKFTTNVMPLTPFMCSIMRISYFRFGARPTIDGHASVLDVHVSMHFLHPPDWIRPQGYSNGIAASGRQIFVAGQVGRNEQGQFPSSRLSDQVRLALINIVSVLAQGNARPEHLVRLTWFITDRNEYLAELEEIGVAYREVIGRHFPTMSLVQVVALIDVEAKVEIEATAVSQHET